MRTMNTYNVARLGRGLFAAAGGGRCTGSNALSLNNSINCLVLRHLSVTPVGRRIVKSKYEDVEISDKSYFEFLWSKADTEYKDLVALVRNTLRNEIVCWKKSSPVLFRDRRCSCCGCDCCSCCCCCYHCRCCRYNCRCCCYLVVAAPTTVVLAVVTDVAVVATVATGALVSAPVAAATIVAVATTVVTAAVTVVVFCFVVVALVVAATATY